MSKYFRADWQRKAQGIARSLQAAQKAASAAIEKLFPIGALVFVQCSGRSFTMRVERHGCSWSDPITVYGVNLDTGKPRSATVAGLQLAECLQQIKEIGELIKKGGAR